MSLAQPKQLHWLPGVAIALLGLGSAILLQRPQLGALTRSSNAVTQEVLEQELVQVERNLALMKQVPSLGFRNLASDWAFLQFLQYFGDDDGRQRTSYGLSPDFFEIVLDRDPYFLNGYFFLSGSSSLYAGKPERTVEIIEQNLPRLNPSLPDKAYYIWRYKAVDELLFLGDSAAAQVSFQNAADWAKTYDDPEGQSIARASARTAAYLKDNPDSTSAQINAWGMLLSNALDDGVREVAIQRMQALGAEIELTPDGQFRITLPPEEPPAEDAPAQGSQAEQAPAASSAETSGAETSSAEASTSETAVVEETKVEETDVEQTEPPMPTE